MTSEPNSPVEGQVGPCGIVCAACDLGNGSVAQTARRLNEYLKFYQVPSWASQVPGGSEVDFSQLEKALNWLQTYALCFGCERGGGPPDCGIRNCSREKGYELCSECSDLEACRKFDWLGETAGRLKKRLMESKGKSKQDIIEAASKAKR
jgi:hypothetical protein